MRWSSACSNHCAEKALCIAGGRSGDRTRGTQVAPGPAALPTRCLAAQPSFRGCCCAWRRRGESNSQHAVLRRASVFETGGPANAQLLRGGSGGIRTHGTRSSRALLLSRQATSPARPRCHSFTTGFEPATSGALGPRSAAELRARCPWWGSNPRPPACGAGALPLSYMDIGVPGGVRTRGLRRVGAALHRLSYRDVFTIWSARPAGFEPSMFPLRRRVPVHSATDACCAPDRIRTCMRLLRREVPIPWTTRARYSW